MYSICTGESGIIRIKQIGSGLTNDSSCPDVLISLNVILMSSPHFWNVLDRSMLFLRQSLHTLVSNSNSTITSEQNTS